MQKSEHAQAARSTHVQPGRVPIIREPPALPPHPEPSPFLILILTRCRLDLAAVAIFGGIQVPSGCDKQLDSMNEQAFSYRQ